MRRRTRAIVMRMGVRQIRRRAVLAAPVKLLDGWIGYEGSV